MADGRAPEAAPEEEERPKPKVNLPHIPFPRFDWKVNDKLAHFKQWEQRMKVLLKGYEIPEAKWHMYILNNLGNEGWARWNTISKKVNPADGEEVFRAFTGRQVVGQVKKVGKSRNFHQKVGKSRNFFC